MAPATPDALPRRLVLLVSALFCVVLVAGFLTRDFGFHWDDHFQVQNVQRTARTGTFLPGWYRYPSLTYWLSLASIAPAAAMAGFEREAVIAEAESPRFLLRGRMLYWTVSYLALFWVAALAWRITRSEPAAFLAALMLALSFEFHYHARWMTSDTINAQLVALAVLLAYVYLVSGRTLHFLATAVVAGLAMGAKYPGGLALLPLGLAILFRAQGPPLRRAVRVTALATGALAITLATFLIVTPGAIFDSAQFWKHIEQELRHYSERGHEAQTIQPGLEHLVRMLAYLGASALSFQPTIAAGLFALAVVGALALARKDWRVATLLVALPLVYLLYFSRQVVMTVRNLQVLLPILAVLAACGVHACVAALDSVRTRRLALVPLAFALAWNAWWLVRADLSIVRRHTVDRMAEVVDWVRRSSHPVFIGRFLREDLGGDVVLPLVREGLVTLDPAAAEKVIMYPRDVRFADRSSLELLVANRRGTYDVLPSGPWEVHWDYYPKWRGDERPIIISSRYYRDLAGLP